MRSAFSEKTEKFVPRPSQAGPSGNGWPGQASGTDELHGPGAEVRHELDAASSQAQHLSVDARLELARQLAPEAQQLLVPGAHFRILAPRELRAQERLLRLRVGDVLAGERGELLELLLASLPR